MPWLEFQPGYSQAILLSHIGLQLGYPPIPYWTTTELSHYPILGKHWAIPLYHSALLTEIFHYPIVRYRWAIPLSHSALLTEISPYPIVLYGWAIPLSHSSLPLSYPVPILNCWLHACITRLSTLLFRRIRWQNYRGYFWVLKSPPRWCLTRRKILWATHFQNSPII